MEPMTLTSVALWSANNSASLPFNTTQSSVPEEWELTVLPPYIFIVSLLGLLLNSFVLGVFGLHKDRLTVAEIYLSNLALADFMLLCCLPFWAMNILNGFNWPYGDALCKIVNSITIVNFYASIYTLVMISVDRYLALVKTMKFLWLRRTLYAKVICVILWVIGLLLSVPSMVHRKVLYVEEYGTMSCNLDFSHGSPWKIAHQVLMNMVGFLLPGVVILFSSTNIVKALIQRQESVGFHDTNNTKATVLVYAVTLLFVLCWGPFQVFTFLDTLCDFQVLDELLWSHSLDTGHEVSACLAFVNSMLNPLLYVFLGQNFKRKVSAIYRRIRQRQRRGSDTTTYQRSVVSTYINRTEMMIKPAVAFNAKEIM